MCRQGIKKSAEEQEKETDGEEKRGVNKMMTMGPKRGSSVPKQHHLTALVKKGRGDSLSNRKTLWQTILHSAYPTKYYKPQQSARTFFNFIPYLPGERKRTYMTRAVTWLATRG